MGFFTGGFGALIGGGLSLAGSLFARNDALRAAQLAARSDADKLKFGIMGQREQQKGMLGASIDRNVTADRLNALQQMRERDAFNYRTGRGAARRRSSDMKDRRAELALRDSPAFRSMRRRQFQRKVDEMRARMRFSPEAGQFGPIAIRRF